MPSTPIYTTEPMATRALAAEIRHDPSRFVELLRIRTGISSLSSAPEVRCEGSGLVDIELTFAEASPEVRIGIEAKFDHEATEAQALRQLAKLRAHGTDVHLMLLLPRADDAPQWAIKNPEVSTITWSEILNCFSESRLRLEDIQAIPLQKRQVERILTNLPICRQPPARWVVTLQRTGSGMPALLLTSDPVMDGRLLRGQLQVSGRPMPTDLDAVRFEYFLGVSIDDPENDLPDPDLSDDPPTWFESLISLRDLVIREQPSRFLVDMGRPGPGRSELGHRKIGLVKKFAPESTWLVKGYIDWALGIKSKKVPRIQLPELAASLENLAELWVGLEAERMEIKYAQKSE